VVVQKGEGRAHGEGLQPEGELGQLYGHVIDVHPVDAALHHHSLQNHRIGELLRIECDAPFGLLLQNHPPVILHLAHQRSIGILLQ